MNEQKILDSKKCFVYLVGIFSLCFAILFTILKVVFKFVVITNTNDTPLQIAINCSILILSTAVSWFIAYLVLRKQNFSEESLKPLIKYLIAFICAFTIIYLSIYLVMAFIDINDAKQRLDALKNSLSNNVVNEYADFTTTITTISSYTNRKLSYASISFLSLLVSNLAALLLISNFLHLRFHPELKREKKPKKEKIKKNKKVYDTQMVENTNKPVQPTPVIQKQETQDTKNDTKNEKKSNYEVQQIEK